MFGEPQLSPTKRKYLMERIMKNMIKIPNSCSPLKRRVRIQSNRVDYRKNMSMIENDSNKTEPSNQDGKLNLSSRRKMSSDQMHRKLPCIFDVTFQNPFFGQFSQRKPQRPTEFQAIVYKRKIKEHDIYQST